MKIFSSVVVAMLFSAVLAGCASSYTPPPECSGAVRKVNPEANLASISCNKAEA